MATARHDYPVLIEPVAPEDGGGFVARVPDLPGCIAEGETAEEALAGIDDAMAEWVAQARALGRPIPAPARSRIAANWTLEHDPEKWEPVFGKDHAQAKR
jgi:predicted RNase H-like HicB family nuclease